MPTDDELLYEGQQRDSKAVIVLLWALLGLVVIGEKIADGLKKAKQIRTQISA